MKKPNINVLGTIHISKKSQKRAKGIFRDNDFDIVFIEGTQHEKQKENEMSLFKLFKVEPFLFFSLNIWGLITDIGGSEMDVVSKLAREQNSKIYNLDNLRELINHFHRKYNFLLFIAIFSFFFIFSSYSKFSLLLSIIVSIILSEFVYLLYFAYKTLKYRDDRFAEKVKEIIEKEECKNILVVFGEKHKDSFIENFKDYNINDLT